MVGGSPLRGDRYFAGPPDTLAFQAAVIAEVSVLKIATSIVLVRVLDRVYLLVDSCRTLLHDCAPDRMADEYAQRAQWRRALARPFVAWRKLLASPRNSAHIDPGSLTRGCCCRCVSFLHLFLFFFCVLVRPERCIPHSRPGCSSFGRLPAEGRRTPGGCPDNHGPPGIVRLQTRRRRWSGVSRELLAHIRQVSCG